jgi:hypothetical protein
MSTKIFWLIPDEIAQASNYDRIHIYRSDQEQTGYVLLADIVSGVPSYVATYEDSSAGNGRDKYYLIRFYDSTAPVETKYYLTFFELTPREMRLVNTLKGMLGSVVITDPTSLVRFTDDELIAGLTLALQYFNVYPPITSFTIDDFPKDYEVILIYGAQITTLLNKYLGLAITDFSYSDNGLSLNLDRGAKVNTAIQNSMNWYNQLIGIAKLEFAFTGEGLGSLQLPVGIGGNLSRGISNLLDVFQGAGR